MVTPPGGSRPVGLEQRQVDDLVRGGDGNLARVLRATPPGATAPEDAGPPDAAARPVDVSAKEMEAIRRSGAPPKRLVGRIAEAERPEEPAPRIPKKGARTTPGAPGLDPPGAAGTGRRRPAP
jgi:hypothetical protein